MSSLSVPDASLASLRQEFAPVLCIYPGQTSPQPAYVELDIENDSLTWDYNGEIGNAVPAAVWHGIRRRYSIPSETKGVALATLLEDVAFRTLLERVLAGAETKWDGNNHVARLTQDAGDAEEEIERLIEGSICEDDRVNVYDVGDWLASVSMADLFEDGDTFAAAVARIEAHAHAEGAYLHGDVGDELLVMADDALWGNALPTVPLPVLIELAAQKRLPAADDFPYFLKLVVPVGSPLSDAERHAGSDAAEAVFEERGVSALAGHIAARAQAAGLAFDEEAYRIWREAEAAAFRAATAGTDRQSEGLALRLE